MKIRNGFVSNSSSSSFILGFSDSDENSRCCQLLIDCIDKSYEDGSHIDIIIKTNQELCNYLKQEYRDYDDQTIEDLLLDNFVKKIYDYSIDKINNGGTVVFGSVGYSDPAAYYIINKLNGITFD